MKKHLLFVFALLTCSALSAQVYLSEDFNGSGTTMPSGWSMETADASSDGWLRDASGNLASQYWGYPDNGTKIMSTNDDNCDCDKSADRLIFPTVDLSSAAAPFVLFEKYFFAQTYSGSTESASLEISTDGGASWDVVSVIPGNDIQAWQTVAYSIADYVGEGDVIVSVVYNDDGGWMFGFGIDNASIQEQPQGLNVSVTTFDAAPLIDAVPTLYIESSVIVGRDIYFAVGLSNTNGEDIVSLDITVSNGSESVTESFSNLNLSWLGNTTVVLTDPIPAAAGNNDYTVTISNVNGGDDDDMSDNSNSTGGIAGVMLHPDKVVLIEEATGTWCGWCVRGTVMMDYMTENYSNNFIGIAVHNEDPMMVADYDSWIGGFIGGYPSSLADRDGSEYDPLDMESITVEKAVDAPAATIDVTHSLSGNTITINLTANYNENLNGDYRLNAILVEDHLSGSGSTWGQTNYYSGGPYGPMGGFEDEGSPVTGLFYDHVGRALVGGVDGDASSLPSSGTAGSSYNYSYTITKNASWNAGYLKTVGVMINNSTGEIVNAKMSSNALVVNEVTTLDNSLILYPNPSNGVFNLQSNMMNARKATVRVYSSTGELVLSRQIQDIRFQNTLDIQEFGSGLYTIVIDADGSSATRRVTVTK